ncbi:MAG: fluoride efflux transporter CrcB [Microbacteriaceae bacterium]
MTALLFVAVAGGLGAVLRFVVDDLVRARFTTLFPLGTAVVNATGSLALGVVTGLALGAVLSPGWELVLGTGVIGGYTTFSTASLETVRLLQDREPRLALLNGFGMLTLTVLLGLLGLWLGSLA